MNKERMLKSAGVMRLSLVFVRIVFIFLSILFTTFYAISRNNGNVLENIFIGLLCGLGLSALLVTFDWLIRRFTLRVFNLLIIGLLVGYLLGHACVFLFMAMLKITGLAADIHQDLQSMVYIGLLLFGTYLGTVITIRSADTLYISIPFVRLTSKKEKTTQIIVDISALCDPRFFELCLTGIFTQALVIPRFVVQNLYSTVEIGNEEEQIAAKTGLENLEKIQEIHFLRIAFHEVDFVEVKDISEKLIRVARLIQGDLFVADSARFNITGMQDIKLISLYKIAQALKPLMAVGESLEIKVQRVGKEPMQGVGYLEDGTMVVINGGGEFIGKTVTVHVLSIKHPPSGRIIFTNLA